MFSLRNLCAVEEASVYLYFPTLERCDKGKERTSRSKSVKVHTRRKQNKIKVKQKIFHSWTVNAPCRTGNLWVYTDRMYKTGTEPLLPLLYHYKNKLFYIQRAAQRANFNGASKHLQTAPKHLGGRHWKGAVWAGGGTADAGDRDGG